jgi:hypothetical protein
MGFRPGVRIEAAGLHLDKPIERVAAESPWVVVRAV